MSFGELLRGLRRSARLTQEELAERAGLSARTVSDLERGVYPTARRDSARSLAGALRLDGPERERFLLVARGGATPAPLPDGLLPGTPITGRDRELDDLAALLNRPDHRLITVIGPGGVGKTRLAYEVARRAAASGVPVAVVPLAGLTEPDLVPSTVARALDERPLLLVLDNFEHLQPAAPAVAGLLAGCPDLTVLATSRGPLHLRAERLVPLEPLAVPPAGTDPAEAARHPACRLFLDRLAAAGVPEPAGLDTVAGLCRDLDGLPLALELAAARVRHLGLATVATRVRAGPAILSHGPADAPDRQRSLEATIGWSHALLSPAEQKAFGRLGVFTDSFCLDAASVFAPEEALVRLIDVGLVRVVPGRSGDRYTMLHTVRAYAIASLTGDERAAAADRHAAWYADLATTAASRLVGAGQGDELHRLDDERNNLWAALRHAIDRPRPADAHRMAAGLWRYWEIRGDLTEARQRIDQVLALPSPDPAVRAEVHKAAGCLARDQADPVPARRHLSTATTLYTALGDDLATGSCLNNLGNVALDEGAVTEAAEHYRRALERIRPAGAEQLIALVQHNLAMAIRFEDPPAALELLLDSLARHRRTADERGVARTAVSVGILQLTAGRPDRAVTHFRSALAAFRELGDRIGMVRAVEGVAASFALAGQTPVAAGLLAAAIRARAELGLPVTADDQSHHLARQATGDPDGPADDLDTAVDRAATREFPAAGHHPGHDAAPLDRQDRP
ncbi:putative ATPase/DNA-binding XRE family transcriptional regulator [Actinoplanes octamycinicus]|uniref:Putative ATPase/DNA-binding XRE family transcriptional regulator n=1 Tax=Actinoplanes octamycinicus TaxID=135948 RepID=A0A7W7GXJ7_9ACTN|nr:tetratricopeptide repeat protein [Actinoplanes octamycinicus]MBB4740170.1 putative ATPase/DNA-binding XRE family transcriptional regulator [Actinoplanes octamycinicus]GIE59567.1 XRE family transcriptional regulator [Actinoplanes octamycinicus]